MISILKFFEKIPNSFYEDISKLWIIIHLILIFATLILFTLGFIKARYFIFNQHYFFINPSWLKPNNAWRYLTFILLFIKIYLNYDKQILSKIGFSIFKLILIYF
jgi:hypothetical protein